MFAVALESLRLLFRRGLPVGEFVDQCWFLARVTTLPLIFVSIPFGIVIALEVGSLLQQIGAQDQLGRGDGAGGGARAGAGGHGPADRRGRRVGHVRRPRLAPHP